MLTERAMERKKMDDEVREYQTELAHIDTERNNLHQQRLEMQVRTS